MECVQLYTMSLLTVLGYWEELPYLCCVIWHLQTPRGHCFNLMPRFDKPLDPVRRINPVSSNYFISLAWHPGEVHQPWQCDSAGQGKQHPALREHPFCTILPCCPCEQSCLLAARPSYLSVAAVAAAFMAKCRIVLSSRYFCSHLVMSASKARILSSFSRTSSMRAGALCSGRLLAW